MYHLFSCFSLETFVQGFQINHKSKLLLNKQKSFDQAKRIGTNQLKYNLNKVKSKTRPMQWSNYQNIKSTMLNRKQRTANSQIISFHQIKNRLIFRFKIERLLGKEYLRLFLTSLCVKKALILEIFNKEILETAIFLRQLLLLPKILYLSKISFWTIFKKMDTVFIKLLQILMEY